MSKILITGSSSGLGKALTSTLRDQGHDMYQYDLQLECDVRYPHHVDPNCELDVLINCAGVNLIDWLDRFSSEDWDTVMDTNAKGIFMMSKAYLPALIRSKGTIINIISNAAHSPMRCSAAYNASKGAALILTKQLARELAENDITVFSVSPNKLKGTGMSESIDRQVERVRGWSKEEAQKYQLAGLLTGEETPVMCVAEFITYLLQRKINHKYLTGCDIPYGA